MYYLVYINQIRQLRVVPHSWIRELNTHLEVFINDGVDSNRKFRVFWTNNPEAFDNTGTPRFGYRPNINAGFSSIFPNDGYYESRP